MFLKEIKWGIIGCGDVTEVKNGPPLYQIEHSSLVAVMRRNGEKAADYAKRHQVPKWYGSSEALIHDSEVNAIYVATPPDTHASYTIAALSAGKPVYVEKPMARNHQECLDMVKTAEQTGLPLFVAYYRRALPYFLKVKTLLSESIIGKPLTVHIKLIKAAREMEQASHFALWRVVPAIAGAGHFYDLASHQFDLLDFLFGPIKMAKGFAVNLANLYKAEDTLSASFIFKSGILGSGYWSFVASPFAESDQMEIIGTKGKIQFSCFSYADIILTTTEGKKSFSFEKPKHIGHHMIQQVVDELRGGGKCVSDMYSGARTSWVLEEIVKDYYE